MSSDSLVCFTQNHRETKEHADCFNAVDHARTDTSTDGEVTTDENSSEAGEVYVSPTPTVIYVSPAPPEQGETNKEV